MPNQCTKHFRRIPCVAKNVAGLLEAAIGGHVPIVAVTAHASTEDRERSLQAGMDEYITKPLRVPELAELLRKVAGC